MTNLRTDPALLRALQRAARPLSPDERHQQRVSFVMGSLKTDSAVTRDQVESVLSHENDKDRH